MVCLTTGFLEEANSALRFQRLLDVAIPEFGSWRAPRALLLREEGLGGGLLAGSFALCRNYGSCVRLGVDLEEQIGYTIASKQ